MDVVVDVDVDEEVLEVKEIGEVMVDVVVVEVGKPYPLPFSVRS